MEDFELKKQNCIFLTGATGMLGAHLLYRFLHETQNDIILLIRAADLLTAEKKIEESVACYFPDFKYAPYRHRLSLALGDITLPKLGLSSLDFNDLAARSDKTVHSAAQTSLVSDYDDAALINTQGTIHMIEFAKATPSQRFFYVSSYSIVGDKLLDKDFVFRESDFDVGQKFPLMPYQKSKFLAEAEVRRSDLDWTITRPGHIFGDSRTGRMMTREGFAGSLFYDIIKNALESKKTFTTLGYRFDISAVDYVSAGMLSIVEHDDRGTFHLCQDNPMVFDEILDLLLEMDPDIQRFPIQEYKKHFVRGRFHYEGKTHKSITNYVFSQWFNVPELCFEESAYIDTSRSLAALGPRGIHPVPTSLELLKMFYPTKEEWTGQKFSADLQVAAARP